ncbi:sigma-70 family RNA polymerase sigma factor [Mycobacterium paraense]|uniref:sigma-70 family RNA polymerase sigma factor n=1 Tax=Mycobacterium paraense TaxID=767916 RepID=UPI000A16BF59|nr:sigma-70 family RNA polymerase sigma factor [Mycobacterium paraense]MCV7442985.1 sigma-70 family RNA polymerase sigma factor [Mycobacterium paraense]ORW46027.1 RNA polymerase subunit sigma-70 [Mycobacterium paraense]
MADTGIDDFAQVAERYRPELRAYCYRMLGSVDECEDLVQDTYLRAWQAYEGFEGRSSVRLWLYKIATNTYLNVLQTRRRRPLPSGLGAPADTAAVALAPAQSDIPWLQPAPDSLLYGATDDPAVVVSVRSSVRLAFVAALQHLSPLQRAVLVLREVLGWQASEVAEMLETSTAAVNSALQRARARLAEAGPRLDELGEPSEPELRDVVDRYMAAFEHADVDALAQLLRADVELEMPPIPTWFTGRDAVCAFLARVVLHAADQWRLAPTHANGAPALAMYRRAPDGSFQAHGLDVLSLAGGRISRIVAFNDAALVTKFGLPETYVAPGS